MDIATSILQKALDVSNGFYVYRLGGTYYNGDDLPHGNYAFGVACIYKRNEGSVSVVINPPTPHNPLIINTYDKGWGGWKTYITNTDFQIISASNLFSAISSGYIIEEGEAQHWGPLIVGFAVFRSESPIHNDQTQLAVFKYKPIAFMNGSCILSNSKYGGSDIYNGYYFYDTTGRILIDNHYKQDLRIIKIFFTYLTNTT